MCLFSGGRIAIGHRYHDLVAGGWGQCPSAERPVTDSKVEGLGATSAVVNRESPGRGAIGRGTQESQRAPSTYRDHLSIGLPIIGLTHVAPKALPDKVTFVPTGPAFGLTLLNISVGGVVLSRPKISRVLWVPTKTSPLATIGTLNLL